MKLKEFCVNQKWCIGFAEVRRFITSGAIKINDIVAIDTDTELHDGDIVKCGKHKTAIVKES